MKLEGQKLAGIESCMKTADSTTTIYLELTPGEDAEALKSHLLTEYQTRTLNQTRFPNGLEVEVPTENLRKVVEEKRVVNYDWPAFLATVQRIRNQLGTDL